MTERHYRDDFSRGEVMHAFVWISIFALVSALIEVAYLGTHIGGVPAPWPVVAAFGFNLVLVKTADLWRVPRVALCIPLVVWGAGIVGFVPMVDPPNVGKQVLVALWGAGIAGGVWAIARR